MTTKQEQILSLIPIQETTALTYDKKPDSKQYDMIITERQRHEWVMQAYHDKGELAIRLATEIDAHLTQEMRELGASMLKEVRAAKGDPELYNFMMEFMRQEWPQMVSELSAIRKASVRGIYEAVNWSLNVLPPEEHKTFWQRLFGG